MAIQHAKPSEVIDIRPLESRLKESVTKTLIKTDHLEVIRLIVPAGSHIDRHQVPGEIAVQCLEGHVMFDAEGSHREMFAGTLLFLQGGTPHALRAITNSSLLVTILLHHKAADSEK